MKKSCLLAIAFAFSFSCLAQEVDVFAGGNWRAYSSLSGASLEVCYSHRIVPHLSVVGRLGSATAVNAASVEDRFGNFADMKYGVAAQAGPSTSWIVGGRLDLRLALLAGAEWYVEGLKEEGCFRTDYAGVDGTSFVTHKGTRFRWDALVSVGWWITDKISVGTYFDVMMPYVFDLNDYRAGLTVGLRL